jgi:pimeloyl-ACP methyl ester carboxylesterase
MLLGMGMNIASFNNPPMIERFAAHYAVVAIDNRGIGRSSKPDRPWTVHDMAGDTLGVMDRLGIERAHLVGGSLGACIALTIASEQPERVRGLVLHGAAARYPRRMGLFVAASEKVPFLRRQSLKMAAPIFEAPYPPTEASYFNQCRAGVAFDGRRLLSRIAAPTGVLNLTRDQFVPMRYTRELAAGIPGAELRLIDRDHLFILNEPELIIDPALEFLARIEEMSPFSSTTGNGGSMTVRQAGAYRAE